MNASETTTAGQTAAAQMRAYADTISHPPTRAYALAYAEHLLGLRAEPPKDAEGRTTAGREARKTLTAIMHGPDTTPGAVIVDGYDGHTWHQDEAGHLLAVDAAVELAARFNDRCKPEHARFRVFRLVPAGAGPEPAARLLAELFANASGDQEVYAIEDAAVRAGILLKCAAEECGLGVGAPGDACQACGELFSECAICVPGQCPGTECPGNYARKDDDQ